MGISGGEILLILLAVLVLFGSEKMPGIARGLAKGFGEIKKASDDIKREILEGSSGIMEQVNEIKSDFNNQINGHTNFVNDEINGLNSSIQTNTTAIVNDGYNSFTQKNELVNFQVPDVTKEIVEIRERLHINEDVAEIRRILYEFEEEKSLQEIDKSYSKYYQNTNEQAN